MNMTYNDNDILCNAKVGWTSSRICEMHFCSSPKLHDLYQIRKDTHLSNNGPDSDEVVGETSEQGLSIGGPGERGALWFSGVLTSNVGEVGLEGVDDRLGLEVEDLDRSSGSGTEPVSVGGEDEGVDNVSGLERVEVLALVEVPEHGDTVLSTGSGEGSIGRDGEGVDVTSVTVVVGLQLALVELPDL